MRYCIRVQLHWIALPATLFALVLQGVAAAGEAVDFPREVLPILTDRCSHCHGVDDATRKGGLRLDDREKALTGGESGDPAIVPGKPDDSELIRRITSKDESEMMPPPSERKPLSEKQIETLRQWIAEGANYTAHWAFTSPQKASLPQSGPTHPIDAFVAARLDSMQLKPSAPETPAKLCRRLYLDLIGLPPSPQELAAFEKQGVDATIDALLQSERFGEKWARHWLDAARYSDTNGYEKDLQREQWSWRDWVVRALNRDMPYDQFLVEQFAGDMLPAATQDQVLATGFLRNSMLNEEGAIVPEQFRIVEMFDRMDCLGKSVLGLTIQCGQCHSHKFDPLTQDDYYGMFAFLNNSYEAQSWVYTADQLKQISDIEAAIRAVEERLKTQRPQWQQEMEAWTSGIAKQCAEWKPIEATELGSISGLNHPTQESDKSLLMRGHVSNDVFAIARPALKGVTGLRLEVLNHRDLPHGGPGRSGTGGWGLLEVEVFVQEPGAKDWKKLKLVNASADFSEPEQKSPDGKNIKGPVSLLIDGKDETSWRADRGIGRRNQPSVAVVQFEAPLDFPAETQLKIAMRMDDMLGCCRISTTSAPAPAALPVNYAAVLAMQSPAAERTAEQQAALFAAWRTKVPDLKSLNDEIDARWNAYPQAPTSMLHLAERRGDKVRQTHFLNRGNWDQPLQVVAPHTPAALHPLESNGPPDRLAFARWLADRRSPLTARVAVNRIWQAIFGEGFVATPEDFGTRAPVPEYRELLDWLAVDLMEHGWSQKHLIRTILTSATYRQSSAVTPALLERDPRNRWLTRGPRFRADAEVVRDIALTASGLIAHKLGGPGIIPPVPQNVLDYNYTYPSYWKAATAPDRYRRTLYVFRKRSMPDPVLSNFDAPNGDFSCVRRPRSNTALAALTGLNEPIFMEAAQAMALRILREAEADDAHRADYAFRLCTAREPEQAERDEVLSLLQSRRKRLADGWLSIREVATGDAAKLPELPPNVTPQDAAAWTLVARVMLNLDETVTKD